MTTHHPLYEQIKHELELSTPVLQAIGDPTRLHIMLSMMQLPCQTQGGARVGDITQRTNLSRPAVSHHLKILKDAGVVGMREDGTKNYYYLTATSAALLPLLNLLKHIIELNTELNNSST